MAGELPTGTVTFLFTDLEGSTRLWEENPEEMRSWLARHDETLRGAIAERGGHVFATGGDGFAAVFDDATTAVSAAVAAQRGLDLPVRMGLHTGVADERDGDYFGGEVNRAARIMAAANGGQIVVSQACADLVTTPEIELVALGEHVLADLRRPESMYLVVAAGLERSMAPIRSVASYRSNLPAQRSSFVGRGQLVAEVVGAVESNSLVTLTGVGGVGKTRLALQSAAELLGQFSDGVWFCELAPASDASAIAEAIADAMSVRDRQGVDVLDRVLQALERQRTLLVLDNCEHVLDAAADVADEILDRCPDVRLLATSREGLAIEGERIVAVGSLGLPDVDAPDAHLTEAVELFLVRADAIARVPLADRDVEVVAEVCRRLDGIPLAIELAAARTTAMTPSEIAANLDDRFRLLTGGRRKGRDRHQTLRAAIDWSHDLLDDTTQMVLRRLAVFAAGFDLEGATAVCGGDRSAILDALHGLVEKSLLDATPVAGHTRYRMLETIRQYAGEKLGDAREADPVHRAAVDYFGRWATEVSDGLLGPDEATWAIRLEQDLPNVRWLVEWALAEREPALAASLLGPFHRNINIHAAPFVAQAWQLWEEHPEGEFDLAAEAYSLALEHLLVAEYDNTFPIEVARDVWMVIERLSAERSTDPPLLAPNSMAQCEALAGQHVAAYELAQYATKLSKRHDDTVAEVLNLCGMVTWGLSSGSLSAPDAIELADVGIELARRIGCSSVSAIAEFGAATARAATSPEQALHHYWRCYALAPEGSLVSAASVIFGSRAALLAGDTLAAASILSELVDDWRRLNMTLNHWYLVAAGTALAAETGDNATAAKLLATVSSEASLIPTFFPELLPVLIDAVGSDPDADSAVDLQVATDIACDLIFEATALATSPTTRS